MKLSINELVNIVNKGGSVKTGIDVYSDQGILLIDKDTIIKDVKPLQRIMAEGFTEVPFDPLANGGLWDKAGNPIKISLPTAEPGRKPSTPYMGSIQKRITEINETKKLAAEKHAHAKNCIKKVIKDIQKTGGEFDYQEVENTVSDILSFLTENENSFSYLTNEIFSYDDYLYNHSINVCTIATATLQKFNRSFTKAMGDTEFSHKPDTEGLPFTKAEIRNISTGFFLHDVGKVLIPENILNKEGGLDEKERDLVRCHSYEKGMEILNKNNIEDPFVTHTVKFHHCAIYEKEPDCYPDTPSIAEIPTYVKICKLADIYDAMTAKRCYKEAVNPVSVVHWIFHHFAGKDNLLQFILHAFVKTIGIYPAGGAVSLMNGQQAYVIDSEGPIVLPFTDSSGYSLAFPAEPINLGEPKRVDDMHTVDSAAKLISPKAAYGLLPRYLKESLKIA